MAYTHRRRRRRGQKGGILPLFPLLTALAGPGALRLKAQMGRGIRRGRRRRYRP